MKHHPAARPFTYARTLRTPTPQPQPRAYVDQIQTRLHSWLRFSSILEWLMRDTLFKWRIYNVGTNLNQILKKCSNFKTLKLSHFIFFRSTEAAS